MKCYCSSKEEDITFCRKEIVAFVLRYKTIGVKIQHNRFYWLCIQNLHWLSQLSETGEMDFWPCQVPSCPLGLGVIPHILASPGSMCPLGLSRLLGRGFWHFSRCIQRQVALAVAHDPKSLSFMVDFISSFLACTLGRLSSTFSDSPSLSKFPACL